MNEEQTIAPVYANVRRSFFLYGPVLSLEKINVIGRTLHHIPWSAKELKHIRVMA